MTFVIEELLNVRNIWFYCLYLQKAHKCRPSF